MVSERSVEFRTHGVTHRQFLANLARDPARLQQVLLWCQSELGGDLNSALVANDAYTPNERVKHAVSAVCANVAQCTDTQMTDVRYLARICQREAAIRARLTGIRLWNAVLPQLGIAENTVESAEILRTAGRCNYHIRLHGGGRTLVVRYHDPLGKDFIQRHEPTRSVLTYLIMEQLTSRCIGESQVVRSLAPSIDSAEAASRAIVDEGSGDIVSIVSQRIIVQNDETVNSMTLADVMRRNSNFSYDLAASLFAAPIARLHANSIQLAIESSDSEFTSLLKRIHYLLRFPDPNTYLQWLLRGNWITQHVLRGLTSLLKGSSVWPLLCHRVKLGCADMLARCQQLWRDSAQAVAFFALGHLDFAPWNCFLDNATHSRLRVFDFDYLTAIDPAYDVGLAASAFTNYAVRVRNLDTNTAIRLTYSVFECYCDTFQKSAATGQLTISSHEIEHMRRRAIAFAALAFAARIDSASFEQDTVWQDHEGVATARHKDVIVEAAAHMLKDVF